MKNKKSIITLLIVLCVGLVGLTIAYFSNTDTINNIFTTKEYSSVYTEEFVSPDNWLPGDTTNKTIEVENTGDVDQAVRISYTESWSTHNNGTLNGWIHSDGTKSTHTTEQELSTDERVAILNLANTDDWTKVGNYYYYNYKLAPNDKTSTFLESVTFNAKTKLDDTCTTTTNNGVTTTTCNSSGDDYDDATYTLTITIETVQYNKYNEAWNLNNSVNIAESRPAANPYLTRFDGNYTYFGYSEYSEDPTGYDFNYDDYQEQSNNNECPSGYAYHEGDGYYSAGCYYVDYAYCSTGDYNDATGKCEYADYGFSVNINNEWNEYLRNDGTTYEVCGVFLNGTVCMTSSYYNDNYSTAGDYSSDFEDCNDLDDNVVYDGTGSTCLKGYAKAKADEMLSKGASSCMLRYDNVHCSLPSNEYCYINSYSEGVECNSCYVNIDGTYNCS